MNPFLVWELGHLITKELLPKIIDEAAHIDISKYPRVRFCIEVNFDGSRESIVDSGIEVRYRKELRK